MEGKTPDSKLFRIILAIYRANEKTRWFLAEKRFKWQRPEFYKPLGLFPQIYLAHTISPFVKTVELDAVIFAFAGDVEKLDRCLERKVSPDLRGLMETAIFADKIQIVELLLTHGANPHRTVNANGNTFLHEAITYGNLEMVKIFLTHGADPNQKTRSGRKAVWYAYDRKSTPMVKLLEPLTEFDQPAYNVEYFLKMEDQVKAYYAFCKAIMEGMRQRTAAELRVLSLMDFLGLCCANGFTDMYWQGKWAVIPSAELMDAIGEQVFSELLWKCIAIVKEHGRKMGRDPFSADYDQYLELDEEVEKELDKVDFFKHDFDWDGLCRRTMDYVRKNRKLFP